MKSIISQIHSKLYHKIEKDVVIQTDIQASGNIRYHIDSKVWELVYENTCINISLEIKHEIKRNL